MTKSVPIFKPNWESLVLFVNSNLIVRLNKHPSVKTTFGDEWNEMPTKIWKWLVKNWLFVVEVNHSYFLKVLNEDYVFKPSTSRDLFVLSSLKCSANLVIHNHPFADWCSSQLELGAVNQIAVGILDRDVKESSEAIKDMRLERHKDVFSYFVSVHS